MLSFGLVCLLWESSFSMPEQGQRQPLKQRQIPAARAGATETVQTRLTKLFDICRRGDADAAAAYFVYRGPDQSRKWKDTYRATDPLEKAEARDACQRIKGYLDASQGYEFGKVKVEREREGRWQVLEVSFREDGLIKKVLFAFLPIRGRFAIGDIDG